MKKIVGGLCVVVALASCGNKNAVSVHTRIDQYEDSIKQEGGGLGSKEEINAFADRYIATLLEAQKEDPKHPKAATYLDRVHMWYATKGETQQSLTYAKKIISDYPDYVNREMLLETIAATYDFEIEPRDEKMVKHYYDLLLKEYPKMPEEKKEAIIERLKYNHLSFKEYLVKREELEDSIPN